MAEIILGAIVIVVTAALAEEAPPRYRKWLRGLFVVLVVVQAAIQIHSRHADTNERKDERTKAEQAQQSLQVKLDDSNGRLQNVQGQLIAFGVVLGQMRDSGSIGTKQMADALQQIAKMNAQPANKLIGDMTHSEFKHSANALAVRLMDFGNNNSKDDWKYPDPPPDLVGNESDAVKRQHAVANQKYWSKVNAINKQKEDWPKKREAEFRREFPNRVIDDTVNQLWLICNDRGVKAASVPAQYGAFEAVDLSQWITTYTRQCFG